MSEEKKAALKQILASIDQAKADVKFYCGMGNHEECSKSKRWVLERQTAYRVVSEIMK